MPNLAQILMPIFTNPYAIASEKHHLVSLINRLNDIKLKRNSYIEYHLLKKKILIFTLPIHGISLGKLSEPVYANPGLQAWLATTGAAIKR